MPTGRWDRTRGRTWRSWRSRLSPQDHFARYGREVRCDGCGKWQRTDPQLHRQGFRLREMACRATAFCDGVLRTKDWWRRRPHYLPSGNVREPAEKVGGGQGKAFMLPQ